MPFKRTPQRALEKGLSHRNVRVSRRDDGSQLREMRMAGRARAAAISPGRVAARPSRGRVGDT